MNAELSAINNFTKEFKIQIPIEDYTKSFEKTLKSTAKKIQLPGFRKGKVPVEFVRKQYHQNVHGDTLDKLVQKSFEEACKANDVSPLGNLEVAKLDFDEKKGVDYSITFEVKPELENIVYSDLTIEQEVGSVAAADVKKAIDKLLFEHSTVLELKATAKSKKGSYVTLNAQQLDADGKAIAGAKYDGLKFRLSDGEFDKDVEKELTGLKVGSKKVVDRKYADDHEIKDLAGKTETYEFELVELVEREFPELNDEFVKTLKEHSVETVDELKASIKKNMLRQIDSSAEGSLLTNASKLLIEKNKFDVPASMLENYLDRLVEDARRQKGINEEKFREARRESAMDELRWQLVREFIEKAEGIKVADGEEGVAEVNEFIDSLQMSEKEASFFKENDYMRDSFKYQLMNKKLADVLKKKNKIKKVKIGN
jgi:trigger factor